MWSPPTVPAVPARSSLFALALIGLACDSDAQLSIYQQGGTKQHSFSTFRMDDAAAGEQVVFADQLRTDRTGGAPPYEMRGPEYIFNKRWVARYATPGGSYPETWYVDGEGNWSPLDTCDRAKFKFASEALMKQLSYYRHICQVNMVESTALMHGPLQKTYRNEIMCSEKYGCNRYMASMRSTYFYSKCNCTEVNNCFDTRSTFMCDILGDCQDDYAWDVTCSARVLVVNALTWIAIVAVTYWNALA